MASFSVGATGSGLTFQWRKAGTPLFNGGNISIVPGPNSSTLTIDPVGTGDAASYDVVVTSSLGLTATSNPATLSLLSPPAIITNPGDTNVCEGATASFTAAASGNPTPTVQWQVSIDGGANFSDISGATSTTLSFTASASQNGNKFRVVFSNSCSSATTTAATLTVTPPDLAIEKSHTGDFTVGINGTYTLTVTNAGACSTTGNITVTDTLPNGLSFVSGTGTGWSCSATGQDVTCTNAGPLAAKGVSTITLTVGVAQPAVPAITNTATVSTPNDGNATNNADSDPTTVNGSPPTINPGELIITEFRLRGPGPLPTPDPTQQAADEFIEIYNNTNGDITVQTTDGSAGFALVAADSITRFVISNGTVIPARGHFLAANDTGYSLTGYPSGNQPASLTPAPLPLLPDDTLAEITFGGPPVKNDDPQSATSTATPDLTYTLDIPDNAGIALFRTANAANFTLANRLDAVGSTSEANILFKEGTGYPSLTSVPTVDHSFYRSLCSFVAGCTTPGVPKDTDDNSADFLVVSTDGADSGAGGRMGAPGPENLSSPIQRNSSLATVLLDQTIPASQPPNRVRDFTSNPGNNSTFGTLSIRRRVTNNTDANVTRLRFRIVEITTFPPPAGTADLRARTSAEVIVTNVMDAVTCTASGAGTPPCTVTVQGLTLEQPPNQPNGGGFNSSLAAGTITLGTPLAAGASINVQFLLGVQQTGSFRILVNLEALP